MWPRLLVSTTGTHDVSADVMEAASRVSVKPWRNWIRSARSTGRVRRRSTLVDIHSHASKVLKKRAFFIKPPLASARAASCIGAVHLFVCLSVPKMQKTRFSQKTKQFRAPVSIDNQVVHGLFKVPITGPLKSKMAEIRHLENRHDVIFFSADGGPISIKFRKLVQNDMSTAVTWSKSKPNCRKRKAYIYIHLYFTKEMVVVKTHTT